MELNAILDKVLPLPQSSKDLLVNYIKEVSHQKGFTLLRSDKVESNIYFLKTGIVRAFFKNDKNEVTFWFGKEGDAVVSMKSYVINEKGYEDIELLEDCELYELPIKFIQQLYTQDIFLANWGRKFAELEIIRAEERLISFQFKTAVQRYQDLLNNSPDLLQRVQLRHIASYLGITQVSLSRIRGEMR